MLNFFVIINKNVMVDDDPVVPEYWTDHAVATGLLEPIVPGSTLAIVVIDQDGPAS